jgi:hypothetical protein
MMEVLPAAASGVGRMGQDRKNSLVRGGDVILFHINVLDEWAHQGGWPWVKPLR